ncbi:hypothetical protein ABPG75_012782 [Micractinium tetrahymenae]
MTAMNGSNKAVSRPWACARKCLRLACPPSQCCDIVSCPALQLPCCKARRPLLEAVCLHIHLQLCSCPPCFPQDEVRVSFESILDLRAVALRVPQADLGRLPEILQAVPEERRQAMRRSLATVWQRYAYSSWRPYARAFKHIQWEHADLRAGELGSEGPAPASLPATVPGLDPAADDAFATIMAWLYGRIPATQ